MAPTRSTIRLTAFAPPFRRKRCRNSRYHQRLRGGIWQSFRRRGQHHHPLRVERISRRRLRIFAQPQLPGGQSVQHGARSRLHAGAGGNHLRRADQERQDFLLFLIRSNPAARNRILQRRRTQRNFGMVGFDASPVFGRLRDRASTFRSRRLRPLLPADLAGCAGATRSDQPRTGRWVWSGSGAVRGVCRRIFRHRAQWLVSGFIRGARSVGRYPCPRQWQQSR